VRYGSRTGAVLYAKNVDRVATFYAAVLGLTEATRADDHIALESTGFHLVVHRITGAGSAAGDITDPPARRATAAFKPVFFVSDVSPLRAVVAAYGGVMEPADRQWSFNGMTVCDALDPEGNVIQFRAGQADGGSSPAGVAARQ
jgi:catechol 2,3-dioxygenase-like lactoylglutathione lyase family enzyme